MAKAKRLPSGSWRVLLFVGERDGKRRYKSFTASSKRQAEMDAALYAHRGRQAEPLLVGDAIDRYILAKDAVLSPKTIREYKSIRRQAFPGIMGVDAHALTGEEMQLAVNRYASTHSPKSTKNAMGLVTASLALFVPDKRIRVTLPRAKKTSVDIPTDEQLKQLINQSPAALKTAILLASALGLRRSEICALTWDDINIKHNTLRVSKAMVYSDSNLWVVKDTKTTTSTRTLNIPPFLLAHLNALPRAGDSILQLTPDGITYRFIVLRKKLGLSLRFHDLRHYYASLLLALNIPDKYAMQRMGHATPNMLKTVYQHLMQGKQDAITSSLNTALDERFS